MQDTLDDLRTALFVTLRGLQDKTNPLPIEQATATVQVAQALIGTGKLEIEYLKLREKTEDHKSLFLASLVDEQPEQGNTPVSLSQRTLSTGKETAHAVAGGRILHHRMS